MEMNPSNIRWAGHVERTGHEKCIESLFGKTGGERTLGGTRGRWNGAYISRMWCRQWRALVNAVMNLPRP